MTLKSPLLYGLFACVQVIDNVCYRHMGHGYFLEDGAEEDTVFDGNLAVSTLRGTGNVEPMDLG